MAASQATTSTAEFQTPPSNFQSEGRVAPKVKAPRTNRPRGLHIWRALLDLNQWLETITRKRGVSTAPGAVAGMVSQVGHLGQHRLWTPEGLADETIGASRFLVIVSTVSEGFAFVVALASTAPFSTGPPPESEPGMGFWTGLVQIWGAGAPTGRRSHESVRTCTRGRIANSFGAAEVLSKDRSNNRLFELLDFSGIIESPPGSGPSKDQPQRSVKLRVTFAGTLVQAKRGASYFHQL